MNLMVMSNEPTVSTELPVACVRCDGLMIIVSNEIEPLGKGSGLKVDVMVGHCPHCNTIQVMIVSIADDYNKNINRGMMN